ncbi:hypothetical protein ACHJH3_05285 [Campylobacter sp. MOP7]|uniref:hypothetical protein n=1 Tax=Campylobacter canis TaxID=3378588 RepID=UPI00387ED80D
MKKLAIIATMALFFAGCAQDKPKPTANQMQDGCPHHQMHHKDGKSCGHSCEQGCAHHGGHGHHHGHHHH